MGKPSCFIALVSKVYDACNEMYDLQEKLAASEEERNNLVAEVDALERKVASLESIQQDAFALMDACVEECNDYVKLADAKTDAAKQETKNWYSRSVMYDNERRAANAARKAVEMKLHQCRVREAFIFEDYEQLLCLCMRLEEEVISLRSCESLLTSRIDTLTGQYKLRGRVEQAIHANMEHLVLENSNTTDAAPLGDITNVLRACMKKE